jgi:NCS1 family nucleobase:cation symporter-1
VRRTWGYWPYVGFWVTTTINVSGWSGGAALLGLGLTVGQAMAVTVASQVIIVAVWILTGWVGAYWHVSFPIWSRSVWGMRAAYFPLINRIILSFTWTATQGWFGGQCLKVFLGSMFPSIYTMKNTLPESTHMTSADFMCFALFTILTIPLLLIPPEHIRRPMVFVCCTSTITSLALFIYSLVRGRGGGPLMKPEGLALLGVEPARGSALGWAVVYGISTSLGSICAGILNQSDYTRFAVRPRAPFLTLALCQPVVGTLAYLIGIVCTSVAAQDYPEAGLLWTPYELLREMQFHGGPGARAAVFFAGELRWHAEADDRPCLRPVAVGHQRSRKPPCWRNRPHLPLAAVPQHQARR